MSKRIGKYEITAEIGRGGFSRVYRGFDPDTNRPVAVKISTRPSDPEHLSQFHHDAAAAANLRHENIATIYDYGDDDRMPYLVTELLEGRDLYHIMRDGPKFSVLEKMQVMSQVGEGLRRAHLDGVVHRDVKPANVMVLTDGAVKILDFGIARGTGEASLSQNGDSTGSPLYLSPEQLHGSDADALCDVWAYGVLYFELLTGQHPFLSQDNARLIRNITIVKPPSVHSLTRGVPEGLAQVIRRTLAKDRRRRYQSLEDVLADTTPILALLQREQTAGLVAEARNYRSNGQLIAARRSSRRALEIDPNSQAAQELLKSIQHEMQGETLAESQPEPAPVVASALAERPPEPIAPPPPTPSMALPVAAAEPVQPPKELEAMPEEQAAVAEPEPVMAAVAPPKAVQADIAVETATPAPAIPDSPSKSRPALASGAAAAIAAAVAAAKARQEEEEKQQKEKEVEEESAPVIRAMPLAVSAVTNQRLVPPPPTGSLKRENGSGVFVTEDPLVVKRPAAVVMTQRMNAAESAAAVATPTAPLPSPTRLPGTKAIPVSVPRSNNGTVELKTAAAPPAQEKKAPAENLPMRRPPSEIYAKGRRRRSSSAAAEKSKRGKPFPWVFVVFGLVLAVVAGALIFFSWSAPKYASVPSLQPEKMTFAWKPVTAYPAEQRLTLKGGAANASYMATSDEDWLVVTPEGDEANNRSWQIKVEPDKLGTTGPSTNTGWVDVTSAEGFKTQAEVTLKIGAAEAAPPVKINKGPIAAPNSNSAPAAGKKGAPALPKPVATVLSPAAKAGPAKKPAVGETVP